MSSNIGLNNVIKPKVNLPKVNTTKALKASEKAVNAVKNVQKLNTKNDKESAAETLEKNNAAIEKAVGEASKNANIARKEITKVVNNSSKNLKRANANVQKAVTNANNKIKIANADPNNRKKANDAAIAEKNLNNLNKTLKETASKSKSIENDIKKVNGNLDKTNNAIKYLNKVYKTNGTIVNILTNNRGGKYYKSNNNKNVYLTYENDRPKTEFLPNKIPNGNKLIKNFKNYNVNGTPTQVYENKRGIRYIRRSGPKGNGKHYPFGTARFFNNKQLMNKLLL